MAQDGSLVESLPDHLLKGVERNTLERNERIQSIMPQTTKFDSEHEEIIDTTMLITLRYLKRRITPPHELLLRVDSI